MVRPLLKLVPQWRELNVPLQWVNKIVQAMSGHSWALSLERESLLPMSSTDWTLSVLSDESTELSAVQISSLFQARESDTDRMSSNGFAQLISAVLEDCWGDPFSSDRSNFSNRARLYRRLRFSNTPWSIGWIMLVVFAGKKMRYHQVIVKCEVMDGLEHCRLVERLSQWDLFLVSMQ